MNKKFKKLILPASLLVALQANSLGLGNLHVTSTLNETLEGTISLIIDDEDNTDNMKVSIASRDDYKKVGLDKSYVPANITVKLEGEGNDRFISISSNGPVSEPIVSLLLVVDWANGHILREYTLLLAPSMYNGSTEEYSQPAQTQTYTSTAQIENAEDNTVNTTYTESSTTNDTSFQAGQVTVEAGDTLWKLAHGHSSGSVSPQQMMVAIFNNNPSAFQNNDMNFLKKGAVLNIPDSEQVLMIPQKQAISEINSQLQTWSTLQTQDDTSSSSTSPSQDYGIELVPPNDFESQDTNNSSSIAKDSSRVQAQLNQAKEELISSNLENDELASRIAELEAIVADQETVLSLKDTNLAQLQQQLSGTDTQVADTIDDADDVVDDVWGDDDNAETPTEDESSIVDDTAENLDDDLLEDDQDDLFGDVFADDTDVADDISDDINDLIEDTEENTTDETIEDTNEVAQEVVPAVVTTPIKEVSFMDKIMSYKTELMYGLAALLLGVFGFMFMKRKNDDESGDFLDSIGTDDNLPVAESTDENLANNVNNLQQNIEDTANDVQEDLEKELENMTEYDNDLNEPEVVVMDDAEVDDFDLQDIVDNDNAESDNTELSDLEYNLDDIEEVVEEIEQSIETTEGVDVEIDDDLSLDFILDDLDLNDDTGKIEQQDVQTSEEQVPEGELTLDLDIDTTGNDLDEVVKTNDELEELEFDTDAIQKTAEDNLDLANEEELTIEIEGSEEDVDIGLDFDDIVDDDAIDTKLDLAKAYYEMGDVDGAKQMVVEIIAEGNDEQKAKAQELSNEING